jgi:conjugal transfer pilus assembly protein TraV
MNAGLSSVALGLGCMGMIALVGCTTASGLDASSKFACSAPDGVTCMSVSGIYANSKAGSLPAMQPRSSTASDAPGASVAAPVAIGESGPVTERSMAQNSSGVGGASGATSSAVDVGSAREVLAYNAPSNTVSFGGSTPNTTPKAMSAPHSGAPLRTPERIVRVWMAPFEDAEGDLHDQKYFYVTVTPGSWTIEAHRANIKRTFQQVTPLSRNNAANKEQAPSDPEQIAQQQSRAALLPGIPQGAWTEPVAPTDPDSN